MLRSLLIFVFIITCGTTWAQEKIELNIYHTNDMHSRIEPLPDNFSEKQNAGKGGIVRRITFMEQERKKDPELLLLDCGDFSQGTPYYNIFKGQTEVDFMNLCKYDVATIGNHEFDFGQENMRERYLQAHFPIVCANYQVKGTILEDVVKPYVILHRKGLKIGIFGLGTRLEGMVRYVNYKGIDYLDPAQCANEIATYLKEKEKCDLIICLSHLGWQNDVNHPDGDEHMIANSRYIDLVLSGHTHTYMVKPRYVRNLDGKETPVYQMGKNTAYMGHITLTFTK